MTNAITQKQKSEELAYDLEERTARFGEAVIDFCKGVSRESFIIPLISQLVRSGTSVGANYREANQASSPKDFRNKIYIAKKEANETMHWLRMITRACPEQGSACRRLWQEAKELTLIFSKIVGTLNKKNGY
ncbi:MAG: four helix bundle protein [Candidatus Wildermuthbacteria bacterium]|nr:four helix bundle protein [Candidatus Wildermuthbacteria bacterium]